jgi:hypothetical protein
MILNKHEGKPHIHTNNALQSAKIHANKNKI